MERSPKWDVFAKFPLLSKIQTLSHKLLVRQTSNHHHCNQHAQNLLFKDFQMILSSSSWSKTTLCNLRNKYGYQIANAMEKLTLFWLGRNAQNDLIPHACRILDVLIPMAHALRLCIQMFPSYGLYVCIILETAHHRATFRIFCNITQKTTPEDNSHKMFHISSPIVLFSYGKAKIVLGE